jgi:hypothetical protein
LIRTQWIGMEPVLGKTKEVHSPTFFAPGADSGTGVQMARIPTARFQRGRKNVPALKKA